MATKRNSGGSKRGAGTTAGRKKKQPAKQRNKSAAAKKTAAPEVPEHRFNILVCIDGSSESDRALKYAVRLGSGTDANMTLLYVRPVDQGLRTGGLQISVARENILDWGLQLPGMKALNRGRDLLVEHGYLSEDWEEEFKHTDVQGDPLGDNMVVYHADEGCHVTLKLLVSPSVARGILDQCEIEDYDIVILAVSSDPDEGGMPGQLDLPIAEKVAEEHRGTVLVARGLEESHGHLVCVWNNEQSIKAARRDAEIASRCACPVYLYSVARDEEDLEDAEAAVANAEKAIEEVGVRISGKKVEIGDPVEKIIDEGKQYSVIVMSSTTKTGLRRFFVTSTSYEVLQRAQNSVMIAR
jgi:nucleotide-binding universal stress UspA family protein